ncbi:MAG: type II secretion system protein GspM [Methyloprofundus sp.]|nr:type II secretion system protein GspM [Methyloprofundus sp.]
MKDWFLQKTANEQKIIVIAGFLSCLLLSYAFVYLPIARSNLTLEKRITKQQQNLLLMQSMAKKVKRLNVNRTPVTTDSTQIMTLIEKTTKKHQLKITQIKPLSKQRLLISFEKVMFNDAIRWLDSLQKSTSISVDKFSSQNNKNSINLQITLSY